MAPSPPCLLSSWFVADLVGSGLGKRLGRWAAVLLVGTPTALASLVLRQRYFPIGDSHCLEMILAKGLSGVRDPEEEFGRLSAGVVLAQDRLNT